MRQMTLAIILTAALVLPITLCSAQEAPMSEQIVYAPDIVGVERLFLIVLAVPPDAPEIAVTVPPQAQMLDRTPLPTQAEQRRYYFRSVAPAERVEILFAHPAGQIAVPLTIWSREDLREFRELKGVQLPRRWPLGETLPELKQGRTIYTDEQIEEMRGGSAGDRAERYAAHTDDEIWAMQTDSTIPRWHWVNVTYGCPVHGTEIYESRAYYPWIKDATFPYNWKIECPVGHELYPSNDFGADDFTSGEFPDDGIGGGYIAPDGKHYGFIAETNQEYCREMMQVAPTCSRAYIATGDVKYLHAALVAFCRLADEYAYLATMTQHRHRNSASQVERLGQGRFDEGPFLNVSGFTVYPIELPGHQWTHAEAYDMIWPDIERDEQIIPFLQGKGIPVESHEDVRRFIEENLMAVWMQGSMDGATRSNEPYQQRGLVRMAEMLNYERGDEFMDWLYDGDGKMRIFVPNTFFRDGAPYESTGGYNSMHVTALGPIVESIEHLRDMRPEVYPRAKYPDITQSRRYQNVFDFCMDTVTIGRFFPKVGDGGSHPSYSVLPPITWHDASTDSFEHAYRVFREPKLAWALANAPGWQPSAEFGFTREEIEAEAALVPDDWNDASSLHDGYGLAIVRGGTGDARRAAWAHYDHARGHKQDDLLDLGMDAFRGNILSHMGYPRNWGQWESLWSSHNVARQFEPFLNQVGEPQYMADAGIAHVTELRTEPIPAYDDSTGELAGEPQPDYWQRRMLALIDVSPEEFYALDFYRISGGEQHWWSFHAQEGEYATEGIDLVAQEGGTLAGPDVPYGDIPWIQAHGGTQHPTYGWRGNYFTFPFLYNVQHGSAEQPWWGDWAFSSSDAQSAGLHLRQHVLQARDGAGQPIEVAITDGKAASGGSPYEMKWIMMHNPGEEADGAVRTQVLAVLEPYLNNPIIRSAAPIALSGADEAGFEAGAARIELVSGRVDTVFWSADPSIERTAEGGFRFAGRFGIWAERDGEPVAVSLVGGTVLTKNGQGLLLDEPEFRAEITAVDHAARTITISPAPEAPGALVGQNLFIGNEKRSLAYEVLSVEEAADSVTLELSMDPRIGTGEVTSTEDFRVRTSTPFPLQGYSYYEGARIRNADGSAEYRINEVRNAAFAMIDRALHPEATADALAADFPPGTWFEVYDYGVGDQVWWPMSASLTQRAPHTWEMNAGAQAQVNLPRE